MNKADQRVWSWAAKAAQVGTTRLLAVLASACKMKGRAWPEDPSSETLSILEHRPAALHFRPARVQVPVSQSTREEGKIAGVPDPD